MDAGTLGMVKEGVDGVKKNIGGLFGLGANIYGLYQTSKLNRERERQNRANQSNLTNWYNKEYNRDFTSTIDNQAALRTVLDKYKNMSTQADAKAAILGQTDDSRLATKNEIENNFGQFVNNLAARGQDYKDRVLGRYDNLKTMYDAKGDAIRQDKINNWTNFVNNAAGVASNLTSGGLSKKDPQSLTVNNTSSSFDSVSPLPGTNDLEDTPAFDPTKYKNPTA